MNIIVMCLQNKYKQLIFYRYYEKNCGNIVICLEHNEILTLENYFSLNQQDKNRIWLQTFHNKM